MVFAMRTRRRRRINANARLAQRTSALGRCSAAFIDTAMTSATLHAALVASMLMTARPSESRYDDTAPATGRQSPPP